MINFKKRKKDLIKPNSCELLSWYEPFEINGGINGQNSIFYYMLEI